MFLMNDAGRFQVSEIQDLVYTSPKFTQDDESFAYHRRFLSLKEKCS
jgi:hypothetical protein